VTPLSWYFDLLNAKLYSGSNDYKSGNAEKIFEIISGFNT
jgi:hypothetical protein